MLDSNAVFLEPRWNIDQWVHKGIIVGPLPKVFWFTSERKYVWYRCGTPSHFCLVCRQSGSYHKTTVGGSRTEHCRRKAIHSGQLAPAELQCHTHCVRIPPCRNCDTEGGM